MILLKKALRSMLRHKKAYLSCIVLMAIGVWAYVVMNTALEEIDLGKENYYEATRLADAFATVSQIPKTALTNLEEIEGIKTVNGRLVRDVRVIVNEDPDNVYRVRLLSTQIGKNHERLNAYDYEGNDLENFEDILIGYDFYVARNYKEGDTVQLLVNRKLYDFTVQGSIFAPDFVYIVENETELFSDVTRFNIAYVDEGIMMHMLGLEGVYTDLTFEFEEGYVFDDVKDELEYSLKKYGLLSLYKLEDQLSYSFMEQELDSGKSMSTSIPMMFVSMAAVVLYLMLKRIIEQDRTQIGILKAFGFSNMVVLFHYVFVGLLTGFLGALIGLGLSFISISPYIDFYLEYYKMPISSEVKDYSFFIIGGIMSIAGGGIGAYFGARKVIKLKPADAMRPPSPPPVRKDITHYVPAIQHVLTSRGFMATRNIIRNKIRSGFVILGIIFSFGMMTFIGMMNGIFDSMFFNQFTNVLKYDVEIALQEPVDYYSGIQSLEYIDEVDYAEGVLKMPVLLHKGHNRTGVSMIGVKEGNYLYKAYDDELMINHPPSKDGIILSSIVAKELEVEKGDYVYISSPILNEDKKIYVSEVVIQGIGFSAVMDLEAMNDFFEQDMQINSLVIETDSSKTLREELVNSEQVTKIEDKTKTHELYNELLGSYAFLMWIMQLVAISIGFTIIYNTAAISMSERSREYATLRVLGLDIKEVKEIMSFEYWILCLFGIIGGIPFSYFLNKSMIDMIDVDAFAWPEVIPFSAFIWAAVGCILAVAFSNMSTVKAIRKLDMVEVLKERE